MPGHKRRLEDSILKEALKYDITEIDDFDNLHAAKEVILESEINASKIYGSSETHFLVNGSTVGILSAILGVTDYKDEILISRNCHRSVYNAIDINNLDSFYLYPEIIDDYGLCGAINPSSVKEAILKHDGIKAIVIVSPTYDGVVSDIKAIADIAHEYGKILIVDEAHGAHFGLYKTLPVSAVKLGADIVIHSVHKTLPSPTQTALIHINGNKVNKEKVRRNLSIYQTSSPSYLLMAGIDYCMSYIEKYGSERFAELDRNIEDLISKSKLLKQLCIIDKSYFMRQGVYDFDIGKILVASRDSKVSGKEIYDRLRNDYHIQPEMAAGDYCLLMVSIMDGTECFDRLFNALSKLDEELLIENSKVNGCIGFSEKSVLVKNIPKYMSIHEALSKPKKATNLYTAVNCISADYVMAYPPGIPIVAPGEVITEEVIAVISRYINNKLNIFGVTNNKEINIIWEESSTY